MKYRKIILAIHKYLGLVTGIVVFIISITGCCWAFRAEIESLYGDYKKVASQNEAFVTPTIVKKIGKNVFPDNTIHGVVYKKPDDAIEIIFYDKTPEFFQSIFINPYSGDIIQIDNHLTGFFAFILKGHTRIWLPKEVGEQVVGISVLIFIFIIISGFILWIPKNIKSIKQRLKFDWKSTTRWRRKNFDLHTVIGFYICSFALILAFTGAFLSFDWLKYVVYISSGGDKVPQFIIPDNVSDSLITDSKTLAIDNLIPILQKEAPNAESFELHYPDSEEKSIYVEVSNSKGLFYDSDFRFFDQNSLIEIETPGVFGKYKDAKFAEKIVRMNYDIHIGAIGGITGKILAFLVSLLTASLPVTGAFLWYGRRNKKP